MKRVREVLGMTNVSLMVPFCRTVDEAQKVLALMNTYGLAHVSPESTGKKRTSPTWGGEQSLRKKAIQSPSTVTMGAQVQSPTHVANEAECLKVYMMCEIPNNVICSEDFLDVFDGFSIGSNDLTQLCLGVDRDSAVLASLGLFDERQAGIKKVMSMAIASANKKGKYCGICGRPSLFYITYLIHAHLIQVKLPPTTQK